MKHGWGSEGETGEWSGYPVPFTTSDLVYPALLPLMRTPRLPAVDGTDTPSNLSALVRFGERRNLVSARVPSRLKRSLPEAILIQFVSPDNEHDDVLETYREL